MIFFQVVSEYNAEALANNNCSYCTENTPYFNKLTLNFKINNEDKIILSKCVLKSVYYFNR